MLCQRLPDVARPNNVLAPFWTDFDGRDGSVRAARLTDEAGLRRVAAIYAAKGWHVTVRDGAFQDTEGAPTAGPPPYDVYVVTPTVAFGFGTGAENWDHPTRWRFAPA